MNEGRDDAGKEPRSGQGSNQQQDEDGLSCRANALGNGVFHFGPFGATGHSEDTGKQGC